MAGVVLEGVDRAAGPKVRPVDEAQSLAGAAAAFFRRPSPLIIGPALVAAIGGRVYVGGYSWWDLLVPAVILAAQPFTEWLIHVLVLHFQPRTVLGRRIDALVSREHRAHHADPKDLSRVFIPLQTLVGLLAGTAALLLLALPLGRGLSGLIGAYAMPCSTSGCTTSSTLRTGPDTACSAMSGVRTETTTSATSTTGSA